MWGTLSDFIFSQRARYYPALRGLVELKIFYLALEEDLLNTIEEKKQELNQSIDKLSTESGSAKKLKSQQRLLKQYIDDLHSNIFSNRSSTLLMLSSFIEHLFMRKIFLEPTLNNEYNLIRKQNKPTIIKAKLILKKKYEEISKINLDFVIAMNKIRNQFVHHFGMVYENDDNLEYFVTNQEKYDYQLIEHRIILGANFIPNYFEHLETLSLKISEILYIDEIPEMFIESKLKKELHDSLIDYFISLKECEDDLNELYEKYQVIADSKK